MTATMTPQEIVERCLELSTTPGCIVLVDDASSANLRWASNDLTTNGVMQSRDVTVIAVEGSGASASAGVLGRSAVTRDDLADLVHSAEHAARGSDPAEDAQALLEGGTDPDWDREAELTSIDVFSAVAPELGEAFRAARGEDRLLYGFVEHETTTTYLGSSTGLRLRHCQPTGHIGITAKDSALTRSAWVGQATADFTDVSVTALDAELQRRLGWAKRRVELPAGRYDTILPPTAVADLMIYAYWTAGARDAYDGGTVFSRPGKGTRVGEQLTELPVTLSSDPTAPGLECEPFTIAHASNPFGSVFDNGLPHGPVSWIDRGRLSALVQTRHSAALTGLDLTPGVGNLILRVDGTSGSTDDLVRDVKRGLLLTCLWYIREVDPQTLLLTGLTRDGVYLVEDGEVVAAVNNFRFNESPVDLLGRIAAAGSTGPAFSREWGDYFPRTAMPPLRVGDFHMSTVSPAS